MKFTRHRKLIVVFAIISAVNVACDCSADQVWFYGGGQSSGIWNEPNNWYGGVPTSTDHANLNTGGVHCIIDTNHIAVNSAVCIRLTLPEWEDKEDTNEYCYLDMNGGNLEVGGNFEMGCWGGDGVEVPYDRGMFNIGGGTVIVRGYLSIGEDGEGKINMTGGQISISDSLYIPKNLSGMGHLNLNGGTIYANTISMNANGKIDIEGGTLILSGDHKDSIEGYTSSGWITTGESCAKVVVDYNFVSGLTTVAAEPSYAILIDCFESYADDNDLLLTWTDGTDSNNGTGSGISLGTELYRGGSKSMVYQFDNNTPPYYSEACRTYNIAQDWSSQGVNMLAVFFHGVEDNAAEQMYVVLTDSNDSNAMVRYEWQPDDLTQQEGEWWNVWNIELKDVSERGVDLSRIKKFIIGFGDRGNPNPGGSGVVYFDDIGLCSSSCSADYEYLPESDFNRDASVNFVDYAGLATAWLADFNQPEFSYVYDLDSNEVINIEDLGIFADKWLWPEDWVQITVDACDVRGNISNMLTGVNMSWYFDTDQIWADGSMAGYLNELRAGLLRYPGGCETSVFHWEYPYDISNPCGEWAVDLWHPSIDPNDYLPDSRFMDTDDYIQQCRAVGSDPIIGVNIQSGVKYNRLQDSIDEAARWVQYCKDNHYEVKYWYLDNEPYYASNSDAMTASEYAGYIKQFVPAMKAVDPNIKIIIGWENKLSVESYWDDWEYIIEEAGAYFDIADVHWYWAWGYATWELWLSENPMTVREWCGDCPNQKYYGPSYVEDIQGFYDKIKDVNGVSYDIKLASLEWNIAPVKDGRFSMFQHALMQAEMLGQFIEGGLHMACIWPLTWSTDLYGDFRTVLDQVNHEPTPSFYVFRLYSDALGQKLIASSADKAYIRSVAALSQDGKTLWTYLLHKSVENKAIRSEVKIDGFTPIKAEAISLTAPQLSSNAAGLTKLLTQVTGEGEWQCVLPPYSLTVVTFSRDN